MQSRLDALAARVEEGQRLKRSGEPHERTDERVGVLLSPEDNDLMYLNWTLNNCGYASVRGTAIGGRFTMMLHRVVLFRMAGRILASHEICDHINGNKLDNRRENLRLTDRFGNQRNRHSRRSPSGYIGVSFLPKTRGKQWMARLQARDNGKKVCLFLRAYATAEEAARAYDQAAERHGFLTRNFKAQTP